jgi:hypothetical protein
MESMMQSNRPMISAKYHDARQAQSSADLEAGMGCLNIMVLEEYDHPMRHAMKRYELHVFDLLHDLIRQGSNKIIGCPTRQSDGHSCSR